MEELDEGTRRILERARLRQADFEKENDISITGDLALANSPITTEKHDYPRRSNVLSPQTNNSTNNTPESNSVKSRFAALAANQAEYECDYRPRHAQPKEAFIKGASPRMSIGENRASVLFVPKSPNENKSPVKCAGDIATSNVDIKKQSQVTEDLYTKSGMIKSNDEKNVRFAAVIASTAAWDNSTSSFAYSSMNETELAHITSARSYNERISENEEDNTVREGNETQDREEEYGLHTFMAKKKSPGRRSNSSLCSVSSPSSIHKMISPKPFIPGAKVSTHSPVNFDPIHTSSPKLVGGTELSHIEYDKPMTTTVSACVTPLGGSGVHDGRVVADLEASVHKALSSPPRTPNIRAPRDAFRGEQTPVQTEAPSPIRQAALESAKAKTIAMQLEERVKTSGMKVPSEVKAMRPGGISSAAALSSSYKPISKHQVMKEVTPRMPAVHTQWRGATNTPVVQGADPAQPSKPPAPPSSNIKSLRNRWEFSSATGTPLHPDADENELLQAAVKMSKTVQSGKRTANRLPHMRSAEKSPQRSSTYTSGAEYQAARDSPNAKSPRMEALSSPRKEPVAHVVQEDDLYGEPEEVNEEEQAPGDESRIITEAFEFMDASPNKTNTPMGRRLSPASGHTSMYGTPVVACQETSPSFEQKVGARVEQVSSKMVEERDSMPPPALPRTQMADSAESLTSSVAQDEENAQGPLMHTVSFYRRQHRTDKTGSNLEKIVFAGASPAHGNGKDISGQLGRFKPSDETTTVHNMIAQLNEKLLVEQQRISQSSRALQYCRQTHEFRGSREEVDAQRALLLASQTRLCIQSELEKLESGSGAPQGPKGAITISNLQIHLCREFVQGTTAYHDDMNALFYFVVLIKCGSVVLHTAMLNSDDAFCSRGVLEFPQFLQLKNVPPNFACSLEVWTLRTQKERISHEEKYRLKSGGTLKSNSKHKDTTMSSAGGPSAILDTGFQCAGRLELTMKNVDSRKLRLVDIQYPIAQDGRVSLKTKRFAIDKGVVSHRGFLSLYQKTQGFGSWPRYWCALENGEMKFWRCPEDEQEAKECSVIIDLGTSTRDGALLEPHGQYPFSFHLDVWVPKEANPKEMERLRVLMAADNKEMLGVWIDVLNTTVRHVLVWSNPLQG